MFGRYCCVFAMILLTSSVWAGVTTRVSIATRGGQGNQLSSWPSISADGRYVAFDSCATSLVTGDTNGCRDVFVRDRTTGTMTRVSVATDGAQGNSVSYNASISADGRYVAFASGASNLVAGDTNGHALGDVFVRDRTTGTTTRVSVATGGAQGNSDSYEPSISADGRYVAFYSEADNLVAGDTNYCYDVFVHDRGGSAPGPISSTSLVRANLHTHSNDSTGKWGPIFDHLDSPPYRTLLTEAFGFGLNCIGVSDHAEAVTSAEWAWGVTASKATSAGNVALHGFEWTPDTQNHINVFGSAEKVNAHSRGDGGSFGLTIPYCQALYKWLSTARSLYGSTYPVVAQFNHVTTGDSHFGDFAPPGYIAPEDGRDPRDVITLAELAITRPLTPASVDTEALESFYNVRTGEGYWRRALARGWKLAPTLGADNGGRLQASVRRFHTGIYLSSTTVSRYTVLKALQARRTFASMDANAEIQLWRGSVLMGATLGNIPAGAKFTLRYKDPTDAVGSANLKTAVVVLNGTETSLPLTTSRVDGYWQWTITGPNTPKSGGHYLYARLCQSDGDYLFSAPMWFNVNAGALASVSVASVTASANNSGGAQISYSLSAPAAVSVSITNIAGRAIRVLPEAAGEQGLNTALWDGKSNTGTVVPRGQYLVRVQAKDSAGHQTAALGSLRLQ